MATIGQSLTAPESGWKRYDDTDARIQYGNQVILKTSDPNCYNGTYHNAFGGNIITENNTTIKFYGTQFIIIGLLVRNEYQSTTSRKICVVVDGVLDGTYDALNNGNTYVYQVLHYQKMGLPLGFHTVVLTPQDNLSYILDAIDIDETGYLVPIVESPTNLIATAGDSQVNLSWDAVDGAVRYNVKRSTAASGPYTTIATNVTGTSYVDNTVTNGTTYYYVVTAVDSSSNESANSNEASATPVAPPVLNGTALLQVTMNNSNEREYKLSTVEIEGFVNWFNHYTNADTKSYMLNKTVGKEYLAFDKIISFEVIPLTE